MTTTGSAERPATDLGFPLHKHPDRGRGRGGAPGSVSRGVAARLGVRMVVWDSTSTPRPGGCAASSCTAPTWS
ncbi:hypothetical protein [Streptomyces sp. CNQ085]|uniref:hypothetical protein n=1 Tax=Streptomyces sp. CNQ085 TaxID=2886944 RepID=UPI0035ADBE5E